MVGASLITLQAMQGLRVHTWVSEADIRHIRAGGKARVIASGLAGREFRGSIEWVGVSADPDTGNFPVKLILTDETDTLRPGMTATAVLEGINIPDVLLLPRVGTSGPRSSTRGVYCGGRRTAQCCATARANASGRVWPTATYSRRGCTGRSSGYQRPGAAAGGYSRQHCERRLVDMRQLTRWFVDRPLVVTMIMVMVFAMGFLTIADMRYEYNPAVDMGVVNITTIKAGAGPEEIELAITLPLEEELLEVEGVKKVYSNSMENLSVITVSLDLDAAEKQEIMRNIQQAVDRAFARLPQDLPEKPRIEELSTLVTPVMEVHITGDVPEALLRDVARNVADGLREVEGIASVEKRGYRRPEVRIMLNSAKLAKLGISHNEIITAIRARNKRDSGGAVDSFMTEKEHHCYRPVPRSA